MFVIFEDENWRNNFLYFKLTPWGFYITWVCLRIESVIDVPTFSAITFYAEWLIEKQSYLMF